MIDGANIAWNDVQFEAFLLSQVVAKTPMDLADAMFFALTADSAQRGITMAAAKSAFVEHLDLPERIELMGQVPALVEHFFDIDVTKSQR